MIKSVVLLFVLFTACHTPEPVRFSGRTMGTSYHIVLAEDHLPATTVQVLKQQTDSLLQKINLQMSTYIPESEISRFNRFHSSEPFSVSPAFTKVLRLALQVNRETGGVFDVTVAPLVNLWGFGIQGNRSTPPSSKEIKAVLKQVGSRYVKVLNDTSILKTNPQVTLDFSAIAKGYAVDAVADLLIHNGLNNFLAEIGGEVVTRGNKFGRSWKVGIDRPLPDATPGSNLEAVLRLHNAAMATSGDYRNYFSTGDTLYSHEIDPRTGRPVRSGVASVTVLAPSCMLADAMATAIMVMGAEKGQNWAESKPGVETMIILHSDHGFKEKMSGGFKAFLDTSGPK